MMRGIYNSICKIQSLLWTGIRTKKINKRVISLKGLGAIKMKGGEIKTKQGFGSSGTH